MLEDTEPPPKLGEEFALHVEDAELPNEERELGAAAEPRMAV